MSIFLDIAFKLKAPIFQFAQILEYWQSTTTNASFRWQVFIKIYKLTQTLSRYIKIKVLKIKDLQPFSKIITI